MTNVTFTIDEAVLRHARQRAIDEHTSVAAEVRAFLARYARPDSGFAGFLAMSDALQCSSRVVDDASGADR